jgi:hypothetical protein
MLGHGPKSDLEIPNEHHTKDSDNQTILKFIIWFSLPQIVANLTLQDILYHP